MNWQVILSYSPVSVQELEYLLRIFVAMVLGLLIGNERRNRSKAAGLRTHAMVALGSALMMVVSKYGFGDAIQGDGARLAAQVVSGVGFLGAGMIFVRNNLVSGLTTAAGIWTTAGVGLTVGTGMYSVAILSTIMILIMQGILHKFPVFSTITISGPICFTLVNKPDIIPEIGNILLDHKLEIHGMRITKAEKDRIKVEFDVVYPDQREKPALFCMLAARDDVLSVGE